MSSRSTRSHAPHCRVLTITLAAVILACAAVWLSGRGRRDATPDSSRVLGATATTSTPPGRTKQPTLLLEPSATGDRFTQLGTAEVETSVVSLAGGRIRTAPGPFAGRAMMLPAFTAAARYPRAVIKVTNASRHDQLSPGTAAFAWGADFRLDRRSESATDPVDNGDNLIQRGLFGEPAEYKAELDMRRGGCTATGTRGTVIVRTRELVRPRVWYRMRCLRRGNTLTVTVAQLDAGPGVCQSAHASGPIGAIRIARAIPVSIGGKLAPDGAVIRSATDQFNGEIANPVIDIFGRSAPIEGG